MNTLLDIVSDLIEQHAKVESQLLARGFDDPERLLRVATKHGLTPDDFVTKKDAVVFSTLVRAAREGVELTTIHVADVLDDAGVETHSTELVDWLVRSGHDSCFSCDARLVVGNSQRRREINSSIAESTLSAAEGVSHAI